jgi:hypothetical protein
MSKTFSSVSRTLILFGYVIQEMEFKIKGPAYSKDRRDYKGWRFVIISNCEILILVPGGFVLVLTSEGLTS